MATKTRNRDRSTGRYEHEWGIIAQDATTGRELAACATCDKIQATGGDRAEKLYANEAAARRAGEPVDAGVIVICAQCDCADPTALAGLASECDCECHKISQPQA